MNRRRQMNLLSSSGFDISTQYASLYCSRSIENLKTLAHRRPLTLDACSTEASLGRESITPQASSTCSSAAWANLHAPAVVTLITTAERVDFLNKMRKPDEQKT